MEAIYEVYDNRLVAFERAIDKLSRVARKLGTAPIAWEIVETKFLRDDDDVTAIAVHSVRVTGEAPRLNGWTYVGRIERAEQGVVLRALPGQQIPEVFRDVNSAGECDHCQTRRVRRDTYVVRNQNGEFRRVGKQCLVDFLGHHDPHAVAQYIGLWDALRTEGHDTGAGGGLTNRRRIFVRDYLAHVVAVAEQVGWRSSSAAQAYGGVPTYSIALDNLLHFKPPVGLDDFIQPSPEARQTADAIIADTLAEDATSDYERNLHVLLAATAIEFRDCALVASAYARWKRTRQPAVTEKVRGHIGTEGKREEFQLHLISVLPIDGLYGTTYLHRFRDVDDNEIVWFSSSQAWEPDRQYRVRATVKEHVEFRGTPQTVLTRCVAIDQEGRIAS